MGYRVAVVGATGAVGREILKTLAERDFPVSEVAAVASARSAGQEVSFGDKSVLKVKNLDTFDFAGWDIGLFSPGAGVSADTFRAIAPREARHVELGLNGLRQIIATDEGRAEAVAAGKRALKKDRFVRITDAATAVDWDPVKRAQNLAGLKGYVTNIDADVLAGDHVVTAYHDLYQVERSFRMTKTDLAARPVFHRLRDSIEPTSPSCSPRS